MADSFRKERQQLLDSLKKDADVSPSINFLFEHIRRVVEGGIDRIKQEDFLLDTLYDAVATLLARSDLTDKKALEAVHSFFENLVLLGAQLPDEIPYMHDCILMLVGDHSYPLLSTFKKLVKSGELSPGMGTAKEYCQIFESKRGVEAIIKRFKSQRPIDLKFARILLEVVIKVIRFSPDKAAIRVVNGLVQGLLSILMSYTDEDIKNINKKDVSTLTEMLYDLSRDVRCSDQIIEEIEHTNLHMALRFLKSSSLEKRLAGLADIKEFVTSSQDRDRDVIIRSEMDDTEADVEPPSPGFDSGAMVDWLLQNEVIEYIFGPNIHLEVVRRSTDIVRFLAQENALTNKHLDIMWQPCVGNQHRSLVLGVFSVLSDSVTLMRPSRLLHLYHKLVALQPHQVDIQALHLISRFMQPAALIRMDAMDEEALESDESDSGLPGSGKVPILPAHRYEAITGGPLGADILWRFMQDDSGVPKDIANQAFTYLMQFLMWSPAQDHRWHYLHRCIEGIKNHAAVPFTMTLMTKIIASLASGGSISRSGIHPDVPDLSTDEIIHRLRDQGHLADLVLADVTHYKMAAQAALQAVQAQQAANGDSLTVDVNELVLVGRFNHAESLRVRFESLQFLVENSSDGFLTKGEQFSMLWSAFVTNALTSQESDTAVNWFHTIATSSRITDLLQYIFNEHLQNLDPRHLTPTAFKFLQYAFQSANWIAKSYALINDRYVVTGELQRTPLIWKVVLLAQSDQVGREAMTFLVTLYLDLSSNLAPYAGLKSRELVDTCMAQLRHATSVIRRLNGEVPLADAVPSSSPTEPLVQLADAKEATLVTLRCLQLLQKFTEQFTLRYSAEVSAAGLRRHGVQGRGTTLHLTVKILEGATHTLVTHSKETIGALRQRIVTEIKQAPLDAIRVITNGKELTSAMHEKTLAEINMVDHQLITIVNRPPNKTSAAGKDLRAAELSSATSLSLRQNMPTVVLTEHYAEDLFDLLMLHEQFIPTVWELLMSIPSNPHLLVGLRTLALPSSESGTFLHWTLWLNNTNIFRLLYAMQLVQAIMSEEVDHVPSDATVYESWTDRFVKLGGAGHLCNVLLQFDWHHIHQRQLDSQCLLLLLRIISQLLLDPSNQLKLDAQILQVPAGSIFPETKNTSFEQLTTLLLSIIDHTGTMAVPRAATPIEPDNDNLSALPFANEAPMAVPTASVSLTQNEDLPSTIVTVALRLSCSFAMVSIEASQVLLRPYVLTQNLLLGSPSYLVRKAVSELLRQFAIRTIPPRGQPDRWLRRSFSILLQQIFDLFSPGNINRYTLVAAEFFELFESLLSFFFNEWDRSQEAMPIDFNVVHTFTEISSRLLSHQSAELSSPLVEDTVLQGLLKLLRTLLAYFPSLHSIALQSDLLRGVYERCLFGTDGVGEASTADPPCCKRLSTRTTAFQLLLELCQNDLHLVQMISILAKQHTTDEARNRLWNYMPRQQEKSTCGYVGLVNQGATCYMNSILQQFFMIPAFRQALLEAPLPESTTQSESGAENSILLELQTMFTYLQESEKKAYDTIPFCRSFKDYDGNPMNTSVQMDVDEFFNILFDRLESLLKGTPAQRIIFKEIFGGKLIQQIKSLECPHVSSREDPFYALQCDVKNKRSILESLQTYVKGEMLDGDNKYFCADCKRHVNALKRVCILNLPNTLILHLKRFEFDMEQLKRFKINDHCEFPFELNMEPFTLNYISSHDDEATLAASSTNNSSPPNPSDSVEASQPSSSATDKSPATVPNSPAIQLADQVAPVPQAAMYRLVGILVHTGTADSGHYYSFIKEREHSPEHKPEWIQFNDSTTDIFHPDEIPAQCFGGSDWVTNWDPVEGKNVGRYQAKPFSAYMLFYERANSVSLSPSPQLTGSVDHLQSAATASVDQVARKMDAAVVPAHASHVDDHAMVVSRSTSSDLSTSSASILQNIRRSIRISNRQFLRDKCVFDAGNFSFAWNVVNLARDRLPQPLLSSAQSDSSVAIAPSTGAVEVVRSYPTAQNPLPLSLWPSVTTSEQALQLATMFVFNTLSHAKERSDMSRWLDLLRAGYSRDIHLCQWLLFGLRHDPRWLQQHFLFCYVKEVQQGLADVIKVATETLRPVEARVEGYEPPQLAEAAGRAPSAIAGLLDTLLDLLIIAPPHWRNLEAFLSLLRQLGTLGLPEQTYLVRRGAVQRLISFYLGPECPDNLVAQTIPASAATAAWHVLPPNNRRIGDAYTVAPSGSVIALVTSLVSICDIDKSLELLGEDVFGSVYTEAQQQTTFGETDQTFEPSLSDTNLVLSENDLLLLFGPGAPRAPVTQAGPLPARITMDDSDDLSMNGLSTGEDRGEAHAFLSRQLKEAVNVSASCSLYTFLCLKRPRITVELVSVLMHDLDEVKPESFRPFFEVLHHLLLMPEGQEQRVHFIMDEFLKMMEGNAGYARVTLECIQFMTQLSMEHILVRSWLIRNALRWVPRWLIKCGNENLMQAAEALFLELLMKPIPSTTVLLSRMAAAVSDIKVPVIAPVFGPSPAPQAQSMEGLSQAPPTTIDLVSADNEDSIGPSPKVPRAGEFGSTPTFTSLPTPVIKKNEPRAIDPEAHAVLYHILLRCLDAADKVARVAENPAKGAISPTHLVSYLRCFLACITTREHQLEIRPYFQDLFNLYNHIDCQNVECDENKKEILNVFFKLFNGCPENMNILLSNEKQYNRLTECFVSLNTSDKYRYYNLLCLPTFYKILQLLCSVSSVYTLHLSTHNNFDWALRHLVLEAQDYPEVAEELIKLVSACANQSIQFRRLMFTKVLNGRPRCDSYVFIRLIDILLKTEDDYIMFFELNGPHWVTQNLERVLDFEIEDDIKAFLKSFQVINNCCRQLIKWSSPQERAPLGDSVSVEQEAARKFAEENERKMATIALSAIRRWQTIKTFAQQAICLLGFHVRSDVREAVFHVLMTMTEHEMFLSACEECLNSMILEHQQFLKQLSDRPLTTQDVTALYFGPFSPLNPNKATHVLAVEPFSHPYVHVTPYLMSENLRLEQRAAVLEELIFPYLRFAECLILAASKSKQLLSLAFQLSGLLAREAIYVPWTDPIKWWATFMTDSEKSILEGYLASDPHVALLFSTLWLQKRNLIIEDTALATSVFTLIPQVICNLEESDLLDAMLIQSAQDLRAITEAAAMHAEGGENVPADPAPAVPDPRLVLLDMTLIESAINSSFGDSENALREILKQLATTVLSGAHPSLLSDDHIRVACERLIAPSATNAANPAVAPAASASIAP